MKDRYIQHKDLSVDMLLLEFFHDDDKDYVKVVSEDEEEEIDELNEIEELNQGMISSDGLLLFYEKKFSRCPERYWINTLFLGIYMLVANVMLVNLLVALFATTYENVQEEADQIWKLKRFDVVMEYLHKDPIPTPIVSIYHILKICKYFIYSFMASKKHRLIEIVCWPRVNGDHAVSLNKFPLECYPRADERDGDNTLDGLIKQCIASQNTQVEISRQEDEVEEEPEIVIAEVQNKIERLRNSIIELADMARRKNKVYPNVVYEADN